MGESRLKELVKHRDVILLAEIGALIHDIGKLSVEFIRTKSPENPPNEKDKHEKDKHAQWVFEWHSQLERLLNNFKIHVKGIQVSTKEGKQSTNAEISLIKLIKEHHNTEYIKFDERQMTNSDYAKKYLMTLFSRAADGIDSGIDKGAVLDKGKQPFNQTYISTSFGYEFKRIEVEKEELRNKREEFVRVLEEVLTSLNNLLSAGKVPEDNPESKWIELRSKLYKKAKECFSYGLGETRRSANDVTLWDHSHSTASLYKTALANVILSGEWKDPSQVKWKLLLIRFNGLDYIFRGVKIGDIEGRKEAINDASKEVRKLLEVEVPLGNEIYRDENGLVFLVPGSLEDTTLDVTLDDGRTYPLKEKRTHSLKEKIYGIFNDKTKGELKPVIKITEESSRGAAILGYSLEKYKVIYNRPFEDEIKKKWEHSQDEVVCSVCGLKPADQKEKICEDCKELRKSRAVEWAKNRKEQTASTIWIDEIRDKNNRIGIIAGVFDLGFWLNGMWLNTCFTKTLEDLKEEKKDIFNSINSWEDLISAVEEALMLNNPNAELTKFKKPDNSGIKVKELLKALGGESYHNQPANEYFEAIVVNREGEILKELYGIDVTNAAPREKAELLVLFLMRKNPSFARIRRIWETCNRFWERVRMDVIEYLRNRGTRTRYKIVLDQESEKEIKRLLEGNKISKYRAYEIRAGNLRFPVVIVEDDLLLVDYVEDEDEKKEIENALKNEFELYEPSDYGYHSIKIYPVEREHQERLKCEKLVEDSRYIPFFSIIEDYPSINAFIVPLEDAWEIVKKIKKLYEIEFSKVQNRLPLKLGFFAMNRKYPLYSALDCVEKFRSEDAGVYEWKIKDSHRAESEEICRNFDDRLGNYVQKLVLESESRELTLYVSYSLGDSSGEDEFYPYFVTSSSSILLYADVCKNVLNLPVNKVSVKHVKELSKDDRVVFIPSIFDFELLDSNIRRFDLGKDRSHRLFTKSKNKPKPYLLWDIDNFERLRELIEKLGLTTSQVMNLYEMLIAKIEEWDLKELSRDETFKKFVENAIKSTPLRLIVINGESERGKISKEDYEFLKASIMNGIFFDFVDLWHTVLKEKFGKE